MKGFYKYIRYRTKLFLERDREKEGWDKENQV